MSIKSVLKSAVVAWVTVASGSLFAQGTPINAAAYDALVAQGPVASAATVASSTWASKIKQAGTLRLGRVDAYVTDHTLLLNALSLGAGDMKLAGAPFGAQDPYGIGLPKGSDGVAFVNAFLKKVEADGIWAKLWTIAIGERTGSTAVPTPPVLP